MSYLLTPIVFLAAVLALMTFLSRASEPNAVEAERAKWAPYATQVSVDRTAEAYRLSVYVTPTPRRP
jgi:hypothetical protein